MLSSRILSKTSRPAARCFRQALGKRMASTVSGEDQVAHTASGRIKKWAASLPVEVYPLFVIMASSLSFGVWSFFLPYQKDPTLRLHRTGGFGGHNSAMNWRDQVEVE